MRVQDEAGRLLPARVSVTDARGRFFAPDDAWIHADDLLIPARQRIETRYFEGAGVTSSWTVWRASATVAAGAYGATFLRDLTTSQTGTAGACSS